MKISIYTFVKDGLFYDFHCEAMLRHHLPLADEIIVNEGFSSDGTYERISAINSKIRVIRTIWDKSDPATWYIKFKERARRECTGDWCILLDCDEFIPEWEFDAIRCTLAETKLAILPMHYINFYGNYRVYHSAPEKHKWPHTKWTIHKNVNELEIWGDGSNVRSTVGEPLVPADQAISTCHHFGMVRHAARLRQKWHTQAGIQDISRPRWQWLPTAMFNWLPHDWMDRDFVDDLALYDGPFVKAVRDDPDEFTRDDMLLYGLLRKRITDRAGVSG